MVGALTGLAGGGGLSTSASATASAGDTTTGLNNSFQNNSPFQVGGSGRQSQTAEQGGEGASSNNLIVYAALGIAGLAVLLVALRR